MNRSTGDNPGIHGPQSIIVNGHDEFDASVTSIVINCLSIMHSWQSCIRACIYGVAG